MKPSSLSRVVAAVFVGLGVAVAAKMFGVFSRHLPAPPPPVQPPQILVASRNLFARDLIGKADVKVRPATREEWEVLVKQPGRFLPPVVEAAQLRQLRVSVEADCPVLREFLEPLARPDPLHSRLPPGTRAVSLSLPREYAGGGLLQSGDWVAVYLTCEIRRGKDEPTVRSASICSRSLVVAAHDSLWPHSVYAPPQPLAHVTVAANPYRAALIDFGRTHGLLTLAPMSAAQKASLDEEREQTTTVQGISVSLAFAETTGSPVDRARLAEHTRGKAQLTALDLAHVFGLRMPDPPVTHTMEIYDGTKRSVQSYGPPEEQTGDQLASFQFSAPSRMPGKKATP